MQRRVAVLGLMTLLVGLASACGGGTSVGEDISVDSKRGRDSGPRLGERAATPAPTQPPTATQAAPAPAPDNPAPAAAAVVIKIRSDNAPGGSQFEPRLARVQRGATVRWENTDAVARSVEADDASFSSPSIPPGGRWDYQATTPGTFNYHDGTRPYAVASLEVA